jgi:hypothetical protein
MDKYYLEKLLEGKQALDLFEDSSFFSILFDKVENLLQALNNEFKQIRQSRLNTDNSQIKQIMNLHNRVIIDFKNSLPIITNLKRIARLPYDYEFSQISVPPELIKPEENPIIKKPITIIWDNKYYTKACSIVTGIKSNLQDLKEKLIKGGHDLVLSTVEQLIKFIIDAEGTLNSLSHLKPIIGGTSQSIHFA